MYTVKQIRSLLISLGLLLLAARRLSAIFRQPQRDRFEAHEPFYPGLDGWTAGHV